MDPFYLDYSYFNSEIVSALSEVMGYKYTSLINARYKNIFFVPYVNYEGMNSYYRFLMICKSKELCLEFLKKIGIDISKYKVKSLADDFPKELEDLCDKLLGGTYAFEKSINDFALSFKAFIPKYQHSHVGDYVLTNKIDFINAVKGKDVEEVTLENYEYFEQTSEYKRIEELAFYYTEIYEELKTKMTKYLETIKIYVDYYRDEMARRRSINEEAQLELFRTLEKSLNSYVRDVLSKKESLSEMVKVLLSSAVDCKSNIEFFSLEDEDKLNDSSVSEDEKKWILIYRKSFLKGMGIDVDVYNDDYEELIKREEAKRLIPSTVFATEVSYLRKVAWRKATEKFIKEGEPFKNTLAYFGVDPVNDNAVYDVLSQNKVCINGGCNQKGDFVPILYLTIRGWQCGCMDYVLIHEIIHAIECVFKDNDYSCGFEQNMNNPEYSKLPHKETRRKYERLNEVIADLLANEVIEILRRKGCYILDDEAMTLSDLSDYNTKKLLKDLVRLFWNKYRKKIIEARLTGRLSVLTDLIGEDNFEELNEVIDYIDVLIEKGLVEKLKKDELEDPIVIEYNIQRERLERVYQDIDDTYKQKKRPFYKRKIVGK